MSSESWACNCMVPQNGEPPCMMNRLGVIKRDGRWIEPEKDLCPVVVPDKSIIAPEFIITTESFEPYTFSTDEDEDAFAAESDEEVLKWVKK